MIYVLFMIPTLLDNHATYLLVECFWFELQEKSSKVKDKLCLRLNSPFLLFFYLAVLLSTFCEWFGMSVAISPRSGLFKAKDFSTIAK